MTKQQATRIISTIIVFLSLICSSTFVNTSPTFGTKLQTSNIYPINNIDGQSEEWIHNLKYQSSLQDNNGPFTSGSWYLGDAQVYDESCNYLQIPFTKLVSTGSELTLSNPVTSTTYTLNTFVKRPFSDNLFFGLVTYSSESLPICLEFNTSEGAKLAFTFDILTCSNVESFTPSCKLDTETNKISQVTYVYKSPGTISSLTLLGIVLLITCTCTSLICCVVCCVVLCTRFNSRRSLMYTRVN